MAERNESVASKIAARLDGWYNILTGLGLKNKDKRMGSAITTLFLGKDDVEALYQSDDVAARIVDRYPEEGCREGFDIKIKVDDKPELVEKAMAEFERINAMEKLEELWKYSRLYGTAMLYIGLTNGNATTPIDNDLGKAIEYVAVLDRYQLSTSPDLTLDLNSKNFGYPEKYKISSGRLREGEQGNEFHWSRSIRMDGVKLPPNLRKINNNWGDSVLSRLWNALNNFHSVNDSSALIMQDLAQAVFKLKNLSDMIASGETELVTKRLELVARMSSICHAIVIEDGEEYDRKTPSIVGVDTLINSANNRLVSATDMPHTILLGQSPTASNGTGNSTTLQWYDSVKNKQKAVLTPVLTYLFNVIFASVAGGKDKVPKFTIEYRPLWQMDMKEKAEIHKIQSEADSNYADRGILTADEIANSRFGKGEYSLDTHLDEESRAALDKPDLEDEPPATDKPPEGDKTQEPDNTKNSDDPGFIQPRGSQK